MERKRHRRLCQSVKSVKRYQADKLSLFFYLHLLRPLLVERLRVPSVKWITSPARSMVTSCSSPGWSVSTTWISPMYICDQFDQIYHTILSQMLRTLDDIHNSWANVVCGDSLAIVNFAESRE